MAEIFKDAFQSMNLSTEQLEQVLEAAKQSDARKFNEGELRQIEELLSKLTDSFKSVSAKALLQALTEKELAITYNDERSGSVRTVWCTVELGRNRIALYEGGKLVWSEGMTIKLKEARSYE